MPTHQSPRPATRRPRPPRRLAAAAADGWTLRDVVGVAHVAFGALALGSGLFALVFSAESGPAAVRVGAAVALVTGAALALAGLWLRDGQRRGAVLAVLLDVARLVAIFAFGGDGLSVVLAVLLLVGAVSIWPTLGQAPPPPGAG